MKNIPLHTKIILGIIAGLLWGFISQAFGIDPEITIFYIKPAGTIFINLLLMIAMPLVFVSLISGVAQLGDVSKFSDMGLKTAGLFLLTTCLAILLGLGLSNIIKPGKRISEETRHKLEGSLQEKAASAIQKAEDVQAKQPLQPLIDIVPKNIVGAASDNINMLQVVFFSLLIGIALLKIPPDKAQTVIAFFDGLNETIIKLIDMIMILAPFGVFGLISSLVIETNDADLLLGVLWYSLAVIAGLAIMLFIVYPILMRLFGKFSYWRFFKGLRPAMLLAFSTSSSSATLPVTMQVVEKNLGIPEKVSGFVLPMGATINMDGTSLYQCIAAVFIAQIFNIDLSLIEQFTILLTALLASIGSAGVPGAGMVMLVIVLKSVGIPLEGIALILAPDRLLDMCRTLVNVASDAAVAVIVSSGKTEEQL